MHQVSSSRKVIFSPTPSLRFFVAPDNYDAIAINPDGGVEKVYDACDLVVVDTQLKLEIKRGV